MDNFKLSNPTDSEIPESVSMVFKDLILWLKDLTLSTNNIGDRPRLPSVSDFSHNILEDFQYTYRNQMASILKYLTESNDFHFSFSDREYWFYTFVNNSDVSYEYLMNLLGSLNFFPYLDSDLTIYLRIPILISQFFFFSLKQYTAYGEDISILYNQGHHIFQYFREMLVTQFLQFANIYGPISSLTPLFFTQLFNTLGLP